MNDIYITRVANHTFDTHGGVDEYGAGWQKSPSGTVSLPNCLEIGECAFREDQDITAFNLPKVTKIEKDAFKGCEALETLVLTSMTRADVLEHARDWGLVGVYDIQCRGEAEPIETNTVLPPAEGTSPQPQLAYNFKYYITGPTADGEYNIYDEDTSSYVLGSSYKAISDTYARGVAANAFNNGNYVNNGNGMNKSPASVSLPNAIEIEDYALAGSNLSSLYLPNVTKVGSGGLAGIIGLTTISLPSLVELGQYGLAASSATTISLPNCTSIAAYAFQNCTNLTTLDLSSMDSYEVANKAVAYWGLPYGCTITCADGDVILYGPLAELEYDYNN